MTDILTHWNAAKSDMEKEANAKIKAMQGLAGLFARGLHSGGDAVRVMGGQAKGIAGAAKFEEAGGNAAKDALKAFKTPGTPLPAVGAVEAQRAALAGAKTTAEAAAKATGNTRVALGKGVQGLAGKLADSGAAQKAINYGVPTVAGAGALYGAHSMGSSSGREQGLQAGSAQGFDAGVQAGSASANSFDPGVLGRLMEVFTGRQGSPDMSGDPRMAAARQAAIQKILSGS